MSGIGIQTEDMDQMALGYVQVAIHYHSTYGLVFRGQTMLSRLYQVRGDRLDYHSSFYLVCQLGEWWSTKRWVHGLGQVQEVHLNNHILFKLVH